MSSKWRCRRVAVRTELVAWGGASINIYARSEEFVIVTHTDLGRSIQTGEWVSRFDFDERTIFNNVVARPGSNLTQCREESDVKALAAAGIDFTGYDQIEDWSEDIELIPSEGPRSKWANFWRTMGVASPSVQAP